MLVITLNVNEDNALMKSLRVDLKQQHQPNVSLNTYFNYKDTESF